MVALLVAAIGTPPPSKAQLLGLPAPGRPPGQPKAPAPPPSRPQEVLRPVLTPVLKPVAATLTALPTQKLLGATGGVVQGATASLGDVVAGGGALVTGLTGDLGAGLSGVTSGVAANTRGLLGASPPGAVPQGATAPIVPRQSGNPLLGAPVAAATLSRPLAVSTNGGGGLAATGSGDLAQASATGRRRLRAQALLRNNPRAVEADAGGQPVVRGEVLALSPTPAALAKAREAGFALGDESRLEGLGIDIVTLKAPPGLSAVQAVARLRAMDSEGQYDFNHLYQPSGEGQARAAKAAALTAAPSSAPGVRIGLIDGGVAAGHPALAGVRIVQQGFAGPVRPSAHGTAVASLMVGGTDEFRGAAQAEVLFAADVYGGLPTGGSAVDLARALAWMAQNRTPVVNISLVGPPNLTLAAAVQAMIARGHLLVAAVGNDGPGAAPLYPAAYRGVVAVTAVDGRRRLLPEAGRGTHVDFAAPGADMAAAGLDGGFVAVRGTSFAAPLAAGRLARLLAQPDPAAAGRALAGLARQALDLGPPGPDRVYGAGLVAFDLRTDPVRVAARGRLLLGP